ncbi:MAG: hypothetical protein EB072_12090 [Betaproteobacteria bacterium]|nr:hypothetical protein [Betaproteobacteria bacterium]
MDIKLDNSKLPEEFVTAMNSDLNVPAALAVLHDQVRLGNLAIDEKSATVRDHVQAVVSMLSVLGLEMALEAVEASPELAQKIETLIAKRNQAKADKDFATADSIREELVAMGVTIKDLPDKTIWSING